jgi:soluble lytic murein transglycosylase-like protein
MVAALALASMPAQANAVRQWHAFISDASLRFGIPESWIDRVIRADSGGQTLLAGRPIRSRAGAIGLMQLMPATWEMMRRRLRLGSNPDDPQDNILAGTFYLRMMYDRFGYPGLFAAYNAGSGGYARHLATKQPLPRETVSYLGKLDGSPPAVSQAVPAKAPDALFFVGQEPTAAVGRGRPANPLFAVRNDDF